MYLIILIKGETAMKRKLLSLLLVLALALSIIPAQALAASYPLIIPIVRENAYTIPEGEIGYLKFSIWHEYNNERYNIKVYDDSGNAIASVSKSMYCTTFSSDLSIKVDTADLDMDVGTYTVEYWMDFYSFYSWHSAPNKYTFQLRVVPNTCRGNHNFKYSYTLTEATCKEEGCAQYKCTKCGHEVFKELPKAHKYDNGYLKVKPTPTSDGIWAYTCTSCGTTKSEYYSKSHAVKITAQPKKAYAYSGNTVKTTVKATGDGLTYQWYVKNEGAKSYGKSSCTGPTYSCAMTTSANNRMVYCVVTDQYGNSVKTDVVYLKMLASVLTQPKSTTAFEGDTAKVTVQAGGNGLTYTWYVKNPGAAKYSKSSVKTATYSCVMNEQNDGRQVYCVVTDQYGKTATTQVATLSLSRTAKVLTQPKTGYARYGKVVSVSVGAEGDGLTYTWYVKNEGASKYTKSSITGSTYAVKMTSAVNNRQVYCVVKDQYGNTVKTKTVALRMMASIVKQPASVTVANGAKATVTVNADGNGLTYTWYVKNPGATKFTKSSVTGATYSCIMSAKNNGRQVYCVVTDQYGKTVTSNVVTLGMK